MMFIPTAPDEEADPPDYSWDTGFLHKPVIMETNKYKPIGGKSIHATYYETSVLPEWDIDYPLAYPVEVNQYFNRYHLGIDLNSGIATEVLAVEDGEIESIIYDRYGYGTHIIIKHYNGLRTLYSHLQDIYVSEGETVLRGSNIANVGLTGRTTGYHLHFAVIDGQNYINPLKYIVK
jgi:murein DD-endopeptidase MepM/ murein hydrolase activator NlpD